jgi:hypothetical protein
VTSVYFMTDSLGNWNLVNAICDRFGWTPTLDYGPGTGYSAPHLAGTFNDRLPALIAAAPDKVIVIGGANDGGPDDEVVEAINEFWHGLRAALPDAECYATSLHFALGAVKLAALKDAVTRVGGVHVDGSGWFTGTGKIGSPAGDGNRDIYLGSDGVHEKDPEASRFLALHLAFAIRPPNTGLVEL